ISILLGFFQAVRGPKIYDISIPIRNLPKAFEGFKIVQISDLHIGPLIGKNYAERVVNKTNELSSDLVVLTGDIIDGSVAHLSEKVAPLANLKAPHGTLFITGNHEYYWGINDWLKKYRELGLTT